MIRKISGWGRSSSSLTDLRLFESTESFEKMKSARGFIPRGLGRSYGDSAANTGGITLETNTLKMIKIDSATSIAVLGAGVTILDLERESLKSGYFPFVVPGTAKVTMGGAIASDIHGKSHHKVGSFSNHVLEMKLMRSDGIVKTIRPDDDTSDLFWATVGGMGLTGIIVEVTIQLRKVETSYVVVSEARAGNLEELLRVLKDFNETHLYTVAWVDLSGKSHGRGIVSGANHAKFNEIPFNSMPKKLKSIALHQMQIPYKFRINLVKNTTIRVFNFAWFHKPLGKKLQQIQKYMHPLDGIRNWNVIYGKKGFVQYQFVVPLDRIDTLQRTLEILRSAKCSSFLTVLKSFGEPSRGLISFPIQGWTLAIDLPAGKKELTSILRKLDEIVIEAGGRIYLTKDSRLDSDLLPLMYPNLNQWKVIKDKFDPTNQWQSDQGRRLNLC
jgi:decaprenylphospho-beta-D-ribofuranose 2-oxidase